MDDSTLIFNLLPTFLRKIRIQKNSFNQILEVYKEIINQNYDIDQTPVVTIVLGEIIKESVQNGYSDHLKEMMQLFPTKIKWNSDLEMFWTNLKDSLEKNETIDWNSLLMMIPNQISSDSWAFIIRHYYNTKNPNYISIYRQLRHQNRLTKFIVTTYLDITVHATKNSSGTNHLTNRNILLQVYQNALEVIGNDWDRFTKRDVLRSLCYFQYFDLAMDVYRNLKKLDLIDARVYNVMLPILNQWGEFEYSRELVSDYEKSGKVIDDVKFQNVLLDHYGKNWKWTQFQTLLDNLLEKNLATQETFYYGIEAYSKSAAANEVRYKNIEDLYDEMKKRGFPSTIRTLNSMVNAYGPMGYFEKIDKLMAEHKKDGIIPTIDTYNNLIFAHVECNTGLAGHIYQRIIDAGLEPNRLTYIKLLDYKMQTVTTLIEEKNNLSYYKSLHLEKFEKLKIQIDVEYQQLVDFHEKSIEQGYNNYMSVRGSKLLNVMADVGDFERVQRISKYVLSSPRITQMLTFEALARGFSLSKDTSEMQKLLDRLKSLGWVPSNYMLSYTILCFINTPNESKIQLLMEEFCLPRIKKRSKRYSKGIETVFSSMAEYYLHQGLILECIQLLEDIPEGFYPSERILTKLLATTSTDISLDDEWKWYNLLQQHYKVTLEQYAIAFKQTDPDRIAEVWMHYQQDNLPLSKQVYQYLQPLTAENEEFALLLKIQFQSQGIDLNEN
ncbi:hypothetical protein BC833DRAFT_594118 [Globomyces pollinis-pini]|nr:hypothetical protein BC833DRAFT_594118 [Globomyces pollinis-pini]